MHYMRRNQRGEGDRMVAIAAIMQAVMDYQAAGRLSDADYVQISRLIVSLA